MFKVLGQFEKSPQLMRDAYCQTLMEKAATDDRIVALDADLVSSSGMKPFSRHIPTEPSSAASPRRT
jgi:transketolase